MRLIAVAAALLCTPAAFAAPVIVDCGRVLDVKAGVWRERTSVTIDNGVITAVGPTLPGPGDRINLSQQSCLPGLIDMHVHLTSETAKQADAFRDELTSNPADDAYRSVAYAERTLKAGFTTVRDLGGSDGVNISLKRAIAAGRVPGPRIYTAGKAIATTGGHADPTNSLSQRFSTALGIPGPVDGVIDSADQARQAVRARYKEGADLIKITATGGVLSQAASGQNSQFTEEEVRAVTTTAHDYGFRVAAHAHGNEGIKRALRGGVDSIEHGTYMDDEAIALFKKTGAFYVPTISAGRYVAEKSKDADYYSPLVRPKAAAIGPLIQQTFGRAWKAGVKIAFGTDAGVFPHGENAKEFAYMVEAGMPAIDAIRAATINAAELLDQPKRLGRLEPGFVGDLVAVNGDPLADITQLQTPMFVMKDGVAFLRP